MVDCSSIVPQKHIYVHKINFGTLLSIAPFVFLYTFVLATAVISSALFVYWAYRKFGLPFFFNGNHGVSSKQENRRADGPILLNVFNEIRKHLLIGLGGIPTLNQSRILNGNNINDRVNLFRLEIQKGINSKGKHKNKFNPGAKTLSNPDLEGEESDGLDLDELDYLMGQVDIPIIPLNSKGSNLKMDRNLEN